QEAQLPEGKAVMFPTGSLTFKQLKGLLAALPVDVTFVDAEDRVRYFSEGADRVFSRSKAILGREVQHCHPPKSVNVVEQIVTDFRSGKQDVAEFWIDLHGRFIHIRYFAVRDDGGEYLGTLEVTQDLTRLRALEGERRLLEYGTKEP
ncbi:MAG: PAS domain-containing protein, partial [Candidatus Latescibacteria bacterium]|nr:PAS domain-containing protein [Candidatus Latescibacterota bacterium]